VHETSRPAGIDAPAADSTLSPTATKPGGHSSITSSTRSGKPSGHTVHHPDAYEKASGCPLNSVLTPPNWDCNRFYPSGPRRLGGNCRCFVPVINPRLFVPPQHRLTSFRNCPGPGGLGCRSPQKTLHASAARSRPAFFPSRRFSESRTTAPYESVTCGAAHPTPAPHY